MPALPRAISRHVFLIVIAAASLLLAAGPTSAANLPTVPHLTFESRASGGILLEWQSAPAHRYLIQRSDTLGAEETWSTLGTPLTGTGGLMSWTGPREDQPRLFYRLQVSLPPLDRIAFLGDSITEQGSSGLTHILASYFGWARAFGGSRWDPEPNGNTLRFATYGKRSDELSALYMPGVTASQADACVIAYGANDAYQMIPVADFVNNAVTDWQTLRTAGIQPVATTVLPIGSVGGQNAARQARVAEFNLALRAAAAQHGVILCDWTTLLEAVPGSNNGIALDSYFKDNDNLHPNSFASSKLGRALHATLSTHFDFTREVWASSSTWITPNIAFTGTANQPPDQWNLFPPAGATLHSATFLPSSDGNWWQLEISPGSGNFNLTTFADNLGGSPSGKTIEALAEVQVISGSLDNFSIQTSAGGPLSADLYAGTRLGTQIHPADGIVVLRTPPAILGASVTQVIPSLYFSPAEPHTILRIRRCGIRIIE